MAKVGDSLKERLGKGFSIFGKLRIQVSHGTIIAIAALLLILFVAFTVRILPLRWENLAQGKVLLNEFDPYYQFSITKHMVDNGLLSPYWPTHWINYMKWYPDGIDMSSSLPALPMTAAVLYQIVSVFGVNIDLMTFCSVLPAVIAVVSCLIMYYLGKDMGGRTVGLFAALFLALAPSFLQRSALGFFDTEVPGVLGLVLFIFLFLRSLDSNRSLRASIFYALGAGAALAYFIAGWGAAYYVLGLTVLFVFVMVIIKRYSQRLLISYSLTFGLALFIATKVPYISLSYLFSGAVIPVAGVFVVLLIAELLRNNISMRTKLILTGSALAVLIGGFVTLWVTGIFGRSGLQGKFSTVLDPFIRASSPLIDSVAEQRISAWGNLYIELGISILFFLVGMYFTLRNPTNRNIFLLLFAVTSLYFATSMVRLLVLFAPAFAIIAGIGILSVIKPFFTLLKESPRVLAKSKRRLARVSKEYSGVAVFIIFMILVTNFAFSPQTGGMPRAISQAFTPTAISASSLPVGGPGLSAPVGAWLDAVHYLNNNVPSSTAVVMWWDYGNWLSDLGNVTSLCDNTTVNSTQIENVGFIFMANENQSMRMLSAYGQDRVKYIAVFTVLYVSPTSSGTYVATPAGYGDEGKWSWMAKISGQAKDRFIKEGYITAADAWTDETAFGSSQSGQWVWNEKGLNCTVFELMNYAEVQYAQRMSASGLFSISPDQTTTAPKYFKEAYFAGINTSPTQYGYLVPIVAIYSIDWAAYNADMGITG
ncbi:MAG: glycosyltransferase family 39 protein [Candidatus Bathyarchaeota archaeon]|nr:glycosyltransferase family 39 protein [Candidatus Bathyarchaeota archaeon]